ncbi:MAG TPA: hypothetical protein VJ124_21050 [Pyrinomonadaceae bacterium]|nr:hypothetical protein [Pyrinomonadaceae bacterium]
MLGSSNLASLTDPLNPTASLAYHSGGKLTPVTDSLNQQTSFHIQHRGSGIDGHRPTQRMVQFTYESGDLLAIKVAVRF